MVSDEQILSALLTAGSVRQAAQAVNVSEATVRNRLSDRGFRQRYDQLRGDVLQEVVTGLVGRLMGAIETMTDLMESDIVADSVRLNAADGLLRHALRYVSIADLERRIAVLEAAQAEEVNQ